MSDGSKVFVTREIPAAGLDPVIAACDADVWREPLPYPMDDKVTPISPQAASQAASDEAAGPQSAKPPAAPDNAPIDPGAIAKAIARQAGVPGASVEVSGAAERHRSGPDEPLIQALAHMTRHYGNPQPAAALVAGLPVAEQGLSWETFERASDRAGLTVERVSRKLKKFGTQELPAILVMKDGGALVLTGIKKVGRKKSTHWAEFIDPAQQAGGEPAPIERTFDELGRDYAGTALLVRPDSEADDIIEGVSGK